MIVSLHKMTHVDHQIILNESFGGITMNTKINYNNGMLVCQHLLIGTKQKVHKGVIHLSTGQ